MSTHSVEFRLENLNTPWLDALHLGVRCTHPRGYTVANTLIHDSFYFLTRGCVRLSHVAEDGQERSSLFLGPHCLFNEIPALRQNWCSTSFQCVEPVELWTFPASVLEDVAFIAKYPHLMANLVQSMGRKSGVFFQHLAVRNSATSMNLVCTLLLQLAQGRMPRMSQSDVAVLLGLHLTTVARLVRILRSEGIVGRFTKTELQVLNMQRLQELATGAAT